MTKTTISVAKKPFEYVLAKNSALISKRLGFGTDISNLTEDQKKMVEPIARATTEMAFAVAKDKARPASNIRPARTMKRVVTSLVGRTKADGSWDGQLTPTVAAEDENGRFHGIPLDALKAILSAIKKGDLKAEGCKNWDLCDMRIIKQQRAAMYAAKKKVDDTISFDIEL